MLLVCLMLLGLTTTENPSILFLGNSHTSFNDVPAMVRSLLNEDRRGANVAVRTGAYLEDLAADSTIQKMVSSKKYNMLVLQGAKISSSHRNTYSQENAIKLATAAEKANIETFLFAEWPRRQVTETEYILDVYRGIAKQTGSTIVPVGYAWEKAMADGPKGLPLWHPDGNHAWPAGSYVAACAITMAITKGKSSLSWKPKNVTEEEAKLIVSSVRQTWNLTKPPKATGK